MVKKISESSLLTSLRICRCLAATGTDSCESSVRRDSLRLSVDRLSSCSRPCADGTNTVLYSRVSGCVLTLPFRLTVSLTLYSDDLSPDTRWPVSRPLRCWTPFTTLLLAFCGCWTSSGGAEEILSSAMEI